MRIPLVAIIGKPNAGKSVFFNRVIGKKYAVVSDEAGTTRDRVMMEVQTNKSRFILVDTGGLQFEIEDDNIENDVQKQAHLAIEEADVILFLIDSKHDLTSDEYRIAEILRKKKKKTTKIFLVLSKCDQCNESVLHERSDIYSLGFGDPILLSSLHNFGLDEVVSSIEEELVERSFVFKPEEDEEEDESIPSIAVLGKPNVGKSSIINALLSEPKLIVSDEAGTTRDSTDTYVKFNKKTYNFIDTAGVRRRGKIQKGIEKFSVMRTIQSLCRSDIVLFVIDGSEAISKQDQHIAGDVIDQKKGLIFVVNKWDLQEKGEEERKKFIFQMRRRFAFAPWAPVIFVSAKTKKNLTKVFSFIEKIVEERHKRFTTSELNTFCHNITQKHLPSGATRKRPKIYYVTQSAVNPPEFVFFVNDEKAFHFSYRRYVENRIRETFGFDGTAIRIIFREKQKNKQ